MVQRFHNTNFGIKLKKTQTNNLTSLLAQTHTNTRKQLVVFVWSSIERDNTICIDSVICLHIKSFMTWSADEMKMFHIRQLKQQTYKAACTCICTNIYAD